MNQDSNQNYQSIKKAFVKYFEQGVSQENFLGLELEHFVIPKIAKTIVSYYDDNGVQNVIKQLQPLYDSSTMSGEYLIGLERPNIAITLEPGAQLEVSIGKFRDIADIQKEYTLFRQQIDPILDRAGLRLINLGYHPFAKVDDIPLLPKQRYDIMDGLFRQQGGLGVNMMRGTCATQVSIDFASDSDFAIKYRVASFLAPLFAYMTDNSPFFEGQTATPLTRTKIWQKTDPTKTCFAQGSFDSQFGFEKYADYVLGQPPRFVLDKQDYKTLITTDKSVEQLYSQDTLTDKDIAHIISTFFPFVRLKTYLELRVADSLPIDYSLGYMALIKGLFYSADNLNKLHAMFENLGEIDAQNAFDALMTQGYSATIYGTKASELALQLYDLADDALRGDIDSKYLQYILPLIDSTRKRPLYIF